MPNLNLNVTCPTCGAEPGNPCTTAKLTKATENHRTRLAAQSEQDNGWLVEDVEPEAPTGPQAESTLPLGDPEPASAPSPEEPVEYDEATLEKMRVRIGKLLAKAESESALGNEAAAEAALDKATALMTKYAISNAVAHGQDPAEIVRHVVLWCDTKVPHHWWNPLGPQGTTLLVQAVGSVGVAYMHSRHTNGVVLVGTMEDTALVADMLVSVYRQAVAGLKRWKNVDPARTYRKAYLAESRSNEAMLGRKGYAPFAYELLRKYLLGFMVGYARVVEARREAVVEQTTGAELVWTGHKARIDEAMSAFTTMKSAPGVAPSGAAFMDGLRDGEAADLGNRVEAGR